MKRARHGTPFGLLLSAARRQGRFIWQLVGVLET
jgi:hypothetical protein